VGWEVVSSTLPHLNLRWATMVELQWYTAMRPGEVCAMRKSEIKTTAPDLWHFCPPRHKTAHHGVPRRVSLGPTCINLICAWMSRAKGDLLFEGGRHNSNGKPVAVMSYRNAIARACKHARVDPWSPGQIRHSALTKTYNDYDIQHAMEQAGHTTEKTTRRYIDRPDDVMTLADEVARRRG
jgi:integrase